MDVEEKAARGRQLLTVPPIDRVEGIRLTSEAAEQGDGQAQHLMALVRAGKGDYAGALDFLQRAAQSGVRRAQAELAAIAGQWSLAREIGQRGGNHDWSALRRRVSLELWLRQIPARMASAGPQIALLDSFLSKEECDWLIALGSPRLARAPVLDPQTGQLREEEGRSNRAAAIGLAELDMPVALIRARISANVGIPISGFEDTQVLHYKVGETFGAHVDFLDPALPAYAQDVAANGQRVMTFLVYLNHDFEGGETHFAALERGFKGPAGTGVVFSNVMSDGQIDHSTVHTGMPPTRGEKWLLSQWIRARG